MASYLDLWVYTEQLFSPIISLDWTLQYMYAMYYAVETFTTIAYGDCTPKNPVETVINNLCRYLLRSCS